MQKPKICVIGLGYVGLPLARLFSTKYETVGFDRYQARVDALMAGHDATLEVSDELLQAALARGFRCTTKLEDIKDCNFYVVAVPTPVDADNNPDLLPLVQASETVKLRFASTPSPVMPSVIIRTANTPSPALETSGVKNAPVVFETSSPWVMEFSVRNSLL